MDKHGEEMTLLPICVRAVKQGSKNKNKNNDVKKYERI